MKHLIFSIGLMLLTSTVSFAQKYAVIDSRYILENMPDYKDAQKRLDEFSEQWQTEIDAKFADVDKLYKSYQAEQVMLSEEMKQKRQAEIVEREKQAKDLQRKRFGVEGDLFKKRQELVKPIQDKIYNAIQKMANAKAYDLILDKSDGAVFYSDSKLDKSADILSSLGVTLSTKK